MAYKMEVVKGQGRVVKEGHFDNFGPLELQVL
jgi:hypothetical protein